MICNKCNHKLPDDSEFCQYCGNKIEAGFVVTTNTKEKAEEQVIENSPVPLLNEEPVKDKVIPAETPKVIVKEQPKQAVVPTVSNNRTTQINISKVKRAYPSGSLIMFTNLSAIIFMIISMCSIIVAMNVQDAKRNYLENWNTTAVYVVLLLILGVVLGFAIISLIKKRFKLILCLSVLPVVAAIVTAEEGSIWSWGHNYRYSREYYSYINDEAVYSFNVMWTACAVLALIITLLPVIVVAVKKINNNWHNTISYREKCYKRVAKIHKYLEKGIISQEEYERTKKDILKYI